MHRSDYFRRDRRCTYLSDHFDQVICIDRPAVKITLHFSASISLQQPRLISIFHALRNKPDSQAVRER